MKKFFKKVCLAITCLAFLSILAFAVFLYFFDSSIKGNYYLHLATEIDDENSHGSLEAARYYHKAIKSYTAIGNTSGAVEGYIRLGLLHYKFGNLPQVERMALKALALGRDTIPDKMKAKVYILLASTSEPNKAKNYINMSLNISEKLHLHTLIAEAYFLLGKNNEYKAEFAEAEKNYLKAIEAVQNFSSIDRFFDVADLYERLAEVYAGGGSIDKAIQFYNEALEYSLSDERSFATANYMKIIGDLYEEQRNMTKACEMWNQSKNEYAYFGAVAPFSINNPDTSRICGNIS